MSTQETLHFCRYQCSLTKDESAGELYVAASKKARGVDNVSLSHTAIFEYDIPYLCEEKDAPSRAAFFNLENGMIEVTQLVGRFNSASERDEWVNNTFSKLVKLETEFCE